jgi:hypothetical protein
MEKGDDQQVCFHIIINLKPILKLRMKGYEKYIFLPFIESVLFKFQANSKLEEAYI